MKFMSGNQMIKILNGLHIKGLSKEEARQELFKITGELGFDGWNVAFSVVCESLGYWQGEV